MRIKEWGKIEVKSVSSHDKRFIELKINLTERKSTVVESNSELLKMDLAVHLAADPDRDLEVGLDPAQDHARAAEATLDHAAVPAHAHGDHARIRDHALEGRERDHDQRAAPDLDPDQSPDKARRSLFLLQISQFRLYTLENFH